MANEIICATASKDDFIHVKNHEKVLVYNPFLKLLYLKKH